MIRPAPDGELEARIRRKYKMKNTTATAPRS